MCFYFMLQVPVHFNSTAPFCVSHEDQFPGTTTAQLSKNLQFIHRTFCPRSVSVSVIDNSPELTEKQSFHF